MVRAGEIREMSTRQLLVGDVVLLEAGDKIPADGVLTQGDDVSVNESSLTGEAEDVRKGVVGDEDAFLLSGCTLTSGRATMMAIAVGAESRWGRIKVGGVYVRACVKSVKSVRGRARARVFSFGCCVLHFVFSFGCWLCCVVLCVLGAVQ